ncbi:MULTISPECIES: hypothetical protein [unclassified Streptomyces]|uniref:hypothetical protein n=1 Tax=unclassified Streptomyces TaxID=2593676 RepID=UPI0027E4B1D4|nr:MULTISPECIES: hypothetical protein [unclassified Streptomyces]
MSPETVRRWADGGHLAMDRGSSGNRLIDGVNLAASATERAGGPAPGAGWRWASWATARVKSTNVYIDRPGNRPRER